MNTWIIPTALILFALALWAVIGLAVEIGRTLGPRCRQCRYERERIAWGEAVTGGKLQETQPGKGKAWR